MGVTIRKYFHFKSTYWNNIRVTNFRTTSAVQKYFHDKKRIITIFYLLLLLSQKFFNGNEVLIVDTTAGLALTNYAYLVSSSKTHRLMAAPNKHSKRWLHV